MEEEEAKEAPFPAVDQASFSYLGCVMPIVLSRIFIKAALPD
jgi:hypothetical protein